jgi:hypothetical protein
VEECLQHFSRLQASTMNEKIYTRGNDDDDVGSGMDATFVSVLPYHVDIYHRNIKCLLSEYPQLIANNSQDGEGSSLLENESVWSLHPSLSSDIESLLNNVMIVPITVSQLECIRELVDTALHRHFGIVIESM